MELNHAESNTKCNLSFTSNLTQEEYDKYIEAGKALRRNTYRGKDITEYLSAEGEMNLYTQISSGNFSDIYVGDYIIANNIKWLVADIDNYLNTGWISGTVDEGAVTDHHLTIIPAKPLIEKATMNATDTTEGGYYNSQMKQSTLPSILSTYVEPAFGSHVLIYRTWLTNSVSETASNMLGESTQDSSILLGASNNCGWYESKIDLMSEMNVYGSRMFSSSGFDTGIDTMQYAIFHLNPKLIYRDNSGARFAYWLKDVSSSRHFERVANSGAPHFGVASISSVGGVRPRFLIG